MVAAAGRTDVDLSGVASVLVSSFARIPHDAVPAIRGRPRSAANRPCRRGRCGHAAAPDGGA